MTERIRSILKMELSPFFGAERPHWLSALIFSCLFVAFETVYFSGSAQQIREHFVNDLDMLGKGILVFYTAAAIYLLTLFVLATLASSWPVRVLCVALFTVALAVEYSYQNALGRFTNYYDIIAALSATGDQRSDSISAFVSYFPLIPVSALLGMSLVVRPNGRKFGWRMPAGVLLCTSLFYIHLSYVKIALFENRFPNSSFGVFWETLADFAVQNPIEQFSPITRTAVEQPAKAVAPQNNIVLIFDESVLADHLSLNGYTRSTTPYLEELQRKGLLVNWGAAVAAATSSHPSYDAFITGVTPERLEKLSVRESNSLPSIFQYAKAMGYRTILFDGQMKNYWGGVTDDLKYIDEFNSLAVIDRPDRTEDWQNLSNKITDESLRSEGLKQWEIDRDIARRISEIISRSPGNFVFVYKRGCHFPYEKNFPPRETVWKPIYHFKEQYEIPPAEKRDAIINSYDNTLRYNLDSFFKTLASDYSKLPNDTVIVYTSDHGESFYANGKAGHGGDSLQEAAVPLFVLGLKGPRPDADFRASHHNIFAGLLDLMMYPVELRNQPYSVSFLSATANDSRPRYFNPLPDRKVLFDR